MREKNNKSSRLIPILMGLLLVLILIAAAGFLYTRYIRLDGKFLRTNVETLDLRDRGLSDLRSVSRCRDLKTLDVRGNPLTLEDIQYLQKHLPDCEILFDVDVGGQTVDSSQTALHLEDLPADWENLLTLRHLRSLTVERCTNPAAMEELQEARPDCSMSWRLGLGGEWFEADARDLTLPGTAVYYEELLSQLSWFHALEAVTLRSAVLMPEQQRSLLQAYPDIHFSWPVRVGEATVPASAEELVYAQTGLDGTGKLEEIMDLLPELRCVDFTGSAVAAADRVAFREAHDELEVNWSVPINGTLYPCDVELLDFNNLAFADTAELEAAIPFLPSLQKIEMCDTGLSYEALDEFNQRWPDVREVWRVYFSGYNLRTDDTYFCASAVGVNHPYITDRDAWVFHYLIDMEALDLGHMSITDLSFVEYMPHLTYLIIAECPLWDLSPLAACKELKYLEVFHTGIRDLSPLTECPKLESLNVCYTAVPQRNAYESLLNMPSLGRLWYCHCPLNRNQRNELAKQKPDCIFFLLENGEPSGGSWRYDQRYYDMRDALHMYYMPGGTNGVDEDGAQIIVDDWGQEFHLENYDGGPYWWTEPRYSHMFPHIIGVTV